MKSGSCLEVGRTQGSEPSCLTPEAGFSGGATLLSFGKDEGARMARGWESKGVEESQSSADRKGDQGLDLTAEERERHRKRSSLELDRRRVLQEIEGSRSEARRAALRQALSFLESEIAKLES